MVFVIIFKILFFLSLAGILVIIAKKIPTLSRLPEEPHVEKPSLEALILSIKRTPKTFSSSIVSHVRLEKTLRKLKIFTLKINNILEKFHRNIKKRKEANKENKE